MGLECLVVELFLKLVAYLLGARHPPTLDEALARCRSFRRIVGEAPSSWRRTRSGSLGVTTGVWVSWQPTVRLQR
jgi:hypothetical protein